MHKSSFGVHQIEFMIKSSPSLGNSSGIWQHANCSFDLSLIGTGNNGWWLAIDTNFETGWTPVYKLDRSFSFDLGDSSINILKSKLNVNFGNCLNSTDEELFFLILKTRKDVRYHKIRYVQILFHILFQPVWIKNDFLLYNT